MKSAAIESVRWPRRRWVYAVGGVLALQAALVFALGRRAQRAPERPIFRTSVSLLADNVDARGWLSELDDPAMFALPTLDGFSGPAWLKFAPLDNQPAEWSEPPQWLTVDRSRLGSTFSQFVTRNAARPPLVVDKPLPPPINFEPNYPNEPVAQNSRFRIEGEVALRRLLKPLPLKSWAHSDILSNSIVEAVVDADGFVFSAVLLTSSGARVVDEYAVSVTAAAQFEPARRSQGGITRGEGKVATGRLIFEWHTLAASPGETLPPLP